MDKGARVKIVKGRTGVDEAGTVFWKGPNNWGEGDRLGVRGDNGETYWVSSDQVELATGAAPVVDAGSRFANGDRVSFTLGELHGSGTVFWTGESRQGPGQRLGIRNDAAPDGEAVWLDARFARALDGGAPAPAPARPRASTDAPAEGLDAPALGPDDVPEAPPWDDAAADEWASASPGEEPPPDW